jgi:hypothetical protein
LATAAKSYRYSGALVIALISYGIASTVGLVHFGPQSDALWPRFVRGCTSPILVFLINLALAATVVAAFGASAVDDSVPHESSTPS